VVFASIGFAAKKTEGYCSDDNMLIRYIFDIKFC